jgi:hypothetical protein
MEKDNGGGQDPHWALEQVNDIYKLELFDCLALIINIFRNHINLGYDLYYSFYE